MSSAARGLLLEFSQCEPNVPTADFNDWYDEEFAPAGLTVPGITSATRYRTTDKETKPEWLALYDLDSPQITKSPAYLHLRDRASDREKKLVPRLPTLQRRTYTLINDKAKPGSIFPGKFVLVVLWSVSKELEPDLNRWYDEEHTAEIAKVPGWLRARRWKFVEGTDIAGKGPLMKGFSYVVLHEWDRDGYTDTPEWKAAARTPLGRKIIGSANAIVSRHFVVHKKLGEET